MNIKELDRQKIEIIHGEGIYELLEQNIENVRKNVEYMDEKGFTDTMDLLERVPTLFVNDEKTFKNKINKLIEKMGKNYVEEIENDIGILEDI